MTYTLTSKLVRSYRDARDFMNVSRGLSLRYTLNMFSFTVSRHDPWRGVFRGRGILGPYSGGGGHCAVFKEMGHWSVFRGRGHWTVFKERGHWAVLGGGNIGPYLGGGDIGL